ncbi:MAG: hypothetical protein ACRDVO_11875 [Jiangellaceae bacterium]
MRTMFLALHIASGTVAMVLGPLALVAAARRHSSRALALAAYVWSVFVTCLTAVVLSLLDWSRLWWILPLGALSFALALVGYVAVRRGWPRWVGAHGLGGAYIALVTALLVVSASDISTTAEIIAWILPAAVGVPLIVRAHTGARARAQ